MRRTPLQPIALAALLGVAALASASDCVRPIDRLFVVNTRPVGCTTDAARLAEEAYAAERVDGHWASAPVESVLASLDPTLPTVFYIHGNQIDQASARRRGLDVYRRLIRCASDERPVQFVIFSWCSTKVKGLLRDYRVKAARTRPVAWQLAWTLDRLPAGSRVGLLGYSYGARVSSGATHLLAGGSLSGLQYTAANSLGSVRAVFLAAAYDACWNSPRSYHGHALDRIESLLTTVNPRDPAMKYFKWVPTSADPPALGGVGPTGLNAEQASRVRLMRVADSVGRSHDLYEYLAAPGLMQSAWKRLSYSDQPIRPTLADSHHDAAAIAQR